MNTFQSQARRASEVALPGEAVVWTGAAPTGLRLRPSDALMIPFSLLWGGFAIFWESSVVGMHGPPFMMIWGVPFVLIGLYMIVGRFFVDAYFRARTTYTVTDRAAYVARIGLFPSVRRYAGSALDSIEFQPKADGSGTIRFRPFSSPFNNRSSGLTFGANDSLDAFENIADDHRVYGQIVTKP